MNYTRVIPRDFFNESKLLKCMGQISLKILDCACPEKLKITIEENGEPFNIVLDEDGYLRVSNYETTINGQRVFFKTSYNSKAPYPLYCEIYTGIEVEVFDESGNFLPSFEKDVLEALS